MHHSVVLHMLSLSIKWSLPCPMPRKPLITLQIPLERTLPIWVTCFLTGADCSILSAHIAFWFYKFLPSRTSHTVFELNVFIPASLHIAWEKAPCFTHFYVSNACHSDSTEARHNRNLVWLFKSPLKDVF